MEELEKATVNDLLGRFRTNRSWHTLAKQVTEYVSFTLVEGFVQPFNNPDYIVSGSISHFSESANSVQVFALEDTRIPANVVRGKVSLYSHPEIMSNPLRYNNKLPWRH